MKVNVRAYLSSSYYEFEARRTTCNGIIRSCICFERLCWLKNVRGCFKCCSDESGEINSVGHIILYGKIHVKTSVGVKYFGPGYATAGYCATDHVGMLFAAASK